MGLILGHLDQYKEDYKLQKQSLIRQLGAWCSADLTTKTITTGEMAGLFQIMSAVSKQIKMNSTFKVPHMLYEHLNPQTISFCFVSGLIS